MRNWCTGRGRTAKRRCCKSWTWTKREVKKASERRQSTFNIERRGSGSKMSAHRTSSHRPPDAKDSLSTREAITYYEPMEEREADQAPLQLALIRRIFHYTRPYAAKRNWLFVLTFARGLQLPALAWMIGRTINGPIAGRDLPGIYRYAAAYFAAGAVHGGDVSFSPAVRARTGRGGGA